MDHFDFPYINKLDWWKNRGILYKGGDIMSFKDQFNKKNNNNSQQSNKQQTASQPNQHNTEFAEDLSVGAASKATLSKKNKPQ